MIVFLYMLPKSQGPGRYSGYDEVAILCFEQQVVQWHRYKVHDLTSPTPSTNMQLGASSCESCLLPLAPVCTCYLTPSGTRSLCNALLVALPSPITVFSEGSTINTNYARSSRGQARTSPADSTWFNVGTVEAAPQPVFASPEQSGWPTYPYPLPLLGTQWLYDTLIR